MSSNKIIIGLFIVILLLGGILGIKVLISNNQPEQPVKSANITDNSNGTISAISIDDASQNDANMLVKGAQDVANNIKNTQQNLEKSNTELNSDSLAKRAEENAYYTQKTKNIIAKSMSSSIILAGCIVLFYIVSFSLIFWKLGIPVIILKVNIISYILGIILALFGANAILIMIIEILYLISVLIIEVFEFKILGIPPWLIAFVLIPYIGKFIGLILAIWSTWRLGDYFNKGTGFKIGMILLAPIFLPILAFSKDD